MIDDFLLVSLSLSQSSMLGTLLGAYVLCFGVLELCRWRVGRAGRRESIYPGSDFPNDHVDYVVLYAVMILLLVLFGVAICFDTEAPKGESVSALSMLMSIGQMALLYTAMLGILMRTPSNVSGFYAKIKCVFAAWKWILAALFVMLVFCKIYEVSGLYHWVVETFHCAQNQEIVDMLAGGDVAMRYVIAGGAVIMAPICEECCYRGFLYGMLRRYAGPVAAALCSSLVFAAVHTSLAQMLPLVVFALVQCFLYEKTRTLCTVMVSHALFNVINTAGVLLNS